MVRNTLSLSLVAAFIVAACGGGAEPVTPTTPVGSASAVASAAPVAANSWHEHMTKDEQMAFMKNNVAPRMGKVFQAANAQKYADFSCKTCHGPNYVEPKNFLPKLTMKDGKLTAFAEKPEVAKFMSEKVVPEMAAAMGLPPYNPATHQGFGCMGCHAVAN